MFSIITPVRRVFCEEAARTRRGGGTHARMGRLVSRLTGARATRRVCRRSSCESYVNHPASPRASAMTVHRTYDHIRRMQ